MRPPLLRRRSSTTPRAPSRRALSAEGHELTFAIAHLGHFRLTHALWPLLKEPAEASYVVTPDWSPAWTLVSAWP